MNYKDFKELNYADETPMEYVLADVFYKGLIDFQVASVAYNSALERERRKNRGHFIEAATVLQMWLSGNWNNKKDKETLQKRAIHITNLNDTFPKNIYNEKYGYTDKDKEYWDDFTNLHYGDDFNR